MQEQPGVQRLNTGGIEITLRYREGSNVVSLVGSEHALIRLLAIERPELIDALVDAALERKLAALAREVQEDPERFWREHMPPYTLPLPLEEHQNGHKRGRPPGSSNVSREYFWEQYRNAVDGLNGLPRMERPYMLSHLAARTTFPVASFTRYYKKFGAPAGYAKPHE
jgi:hypothetical protein